MPSARLSRGRIKTVLVVVLASLAAAVATANALTQTPVLATSAIERFPRSAEDSTGMEYLAWTQGPRGHQLRVHAYLQRGSEPMIRLDNGTRGYAGGIDLPRVAYQEVRNRASDIYVYDVETGIRSPLPGVNTSRWEYLPSISGDWVLFGRDDNLRPREQIVARNIATGAELVLSSIRVTDTTDTRPGQVNGTWATWWRCFAQHCAVFKRNLAGGSTVRLPVGRRHALYASAVTSDGTVYAARSPAGVCGGVSIRRFGIGDPPAGHVVARLPAHVDTSSIFARENGDGTVELVYEQAPCGTRRFDVYSLHDPRS